MEKNRLLELDILRGIAILAVIGIHVTSTTLQLYGNNVLHPNIDILTNQFINQFLRFATPLFLLLSGATLTLSHLRHLLTFPLFLKKRFLRVLIPYVAWSIILGIVVYQLNIQNHLTDVIKNIFYGTADYHLYFIVLILQFYVLFPFLFSLLQKMTNVHSIRLVGSILLIQMLLLMWYMWTSRLGNAIPGDIAFRLFPFWFIYFLVGIMCGFLFESISRVISKIILWKLLVWMFLGALLLMIEIRLFMVQYFEAINFLRPSVVVYTLISGITLFRLSQSLVNVRSNFLVHLRHRLLLIGKYSFSMYLVHTLVLRWIFAIIGIQNLSIFFSLFAWLLTVLGTFSLVYGFHAIRMFVSSRSHMLY